MLKLNTPVDIAKSKIDIKMSTPCLIVGSCFADNIGNIMTTNGFRTLVNPLGTTYNPASVRATIERIAGGTPFTHGDCTTIGAGDNRTCTFWHHTRNARQDEASFLADANAQLSAAHTFWQECEVLIVTLGTAWCFRHKATDQIVSNCLKHHPAEFDRFRMSVEECREHLEAVVRLAENQCGGNKRKVIFTVSPIRHWADTAHGNMLSKATLHLAADGVIANHADMTDYFPSFEILMDELRDYRFYTDDMNHPTPLAERYVFERFMDFVLPDSERSLLAEGIKRAKREGHRETKK